MWVLFKKKKNSLIETLSQEDKKTAAWPGALLQSTVAAWAPSLFGSYTISRQNQLAHPAHLGTLM